MRFQLIIHLNHITTMYKLLIFPILALSILCSSCSKQIKGKVLDNFGNPVQDVAVTISNSQYESKTNGSGEYSIDYAAGEIILNFNKEGYYRSGEVLYITEKQDYPARDIILIKTPAQSGIYISTKEVPDYMKLLKGNSIDRKQLATRKYEFYLQNRDSINIIKTSSLEDVGIYHFNFKKHQLGIVGEDNKVAEVLSGLLGKVTANQYIKGASVDYSENMHKHLITPQYDVDYIYIFENGFKNINNPNTSYCLFRFEK